MKNLTWQNPEQLFVAQELINKVKSKCCGIKDKFIFLFSLFYVFLFLGVNTLTNGLDFLFTIPFNFLGVYVSYLLVLKQLDVKNKLADKICVAFSSKNGCNAALESSVSKLFGILL